MESVKTLWPFSELPPKVISIYEGPEEFLKGFASVSEQHGTSFSAFWLQAEVLNGGLIQFFSNSTGVLAPEAVAACRRVGLPNLAAKVEEAMAWFGREYPRERGAREEALEAFAREAPELDGPFGEQEEAVVDLIYNEGPGLEVAVQKYLEAYDS